MVLSAYCYFQRAHYPLKGKRMILKRSLCQSIYSSRETVEFRCYFKTSLSTQHAGDYLSCSGDTIPCIQLDKFVLQQQNKHVNEYAIYLTYQYVTTKVLPSSSDIEFSALAYQKLHHQLNQEQQHPTCRTIVTIF